MALQKQVLNIDLSKGLDEKNNREVAPEQVSLQSIVNCVQDETGAWTMRPGLSARCTYLEDATGTPSIYPFRKLARTQEGVGAVAGTCNFYQLNEYQNLCTVKGPVSDFGVESRAVASNASANLGENRGVLVYGAAEVYGYSFVMYESGQASSGFGNDITLVAYEKAGGQVVRTWRLRDLFTPVVSPLTRMRAKMVVIDSYYIHLVATWEAQAYSVFINAAALLPSALTPVALTVNGATPKVCDVCQCYGRSVFLMYDRLTASNYDVLSFTGSTGTFIEEATLVSTAGAAGKVHGICTDFTNLYWLADDGIANTSIDHVPVSSLTSTPTNDALEAAYSYEEMCITGTASAGEFYITKNVEILGGTLPAIYLYTDITSTSIFGTVKKFAGWTAVSCPFFSHRALKVYQQWAKWDSISAGIGLQCIVKLNDIVESQDWDAAAVLAGTPRLRTVKPVATLDPFTASIPLDALPLYITQVIPDTSFTNKEFSINRVWSYNFVHFLTCYSQRITPMSSNVVIASLKTLDPKYQWNSDQFGPYTAIVGGTSSLCDSARAYEMGFLDMPNGAATVSGTAGILNGSYKYIFVFKYTDALGNVHYSRTNGPYAVVPSNKKVDITATWPAVTNREREGEMPNVICEVYRTLVGGTRYYWLTSSRRGDGFNPPAATFGYFAYADNIADATIAVRQELFRQPGLLGSPVDRYCPPASGIICQHKDRLFFADPLGQGRMFFTSFFVDSEGPWCNPLMTVYCHGGSGPITGAVSMDGRLVVFKRNAIFIIDGDGPGENAGSGTEYTVQRLSCEFGCTDSRSIVSTPVGIMYRSDRGIEMITRSLQVQFIGERIKRTTAEYPFPMGACFDKDTGHANMLVAKVESDAGVADCTVLAYNTVQDCWSEKRIRAVSGYDEFLHTVAGQTKADSSGYIHDQVFYLTASDIFYENPVSGLDYASPVPQVMETGWVKVSGLNGRQRIYSAIVLLKRRNAHDLKLSLAYNGVESYTQHVTFPATVTDDVPEQLIIQPSNQQPNSIKLRIMDVTAAPTYYDRGFDILGIAFSLSPKDDVQKLTKDNKG